MHFFAVVSPFLLVSLLASAAPLPVPRDNAPPTVNLPTADMFSQIPGINASEIIANLTSFVPRAIALAEVDKSCSNNASDILGALTLALYVADTARNVQAQDMAYNAFFLPEELDSVKSMFDAMVKNETTKAKKQFKIACPAEGEHKFSNTTAAVTDHLDSLIHLPRIRLNPGLFSSNSTTGNSTALTGSSNSTLPNVVGMVGISYALLQEMTHLPQFGKAAKLSSQACDSSASSSRGTCDVGLLGDEKNTGKKYGDRFQSPIEQAVCLKSRWAAYNEKGASGLKQPPVPPSKNAGNYAAFGVFYLGEKLTASIPEASGLMTFVLAMMGQQC